MTWKPWVVVAALLAGCTPENGPLMRPGDDCLRCHGGSATVGQEGGEDERSAAAWSLAGTVYTSLNGSPNEGVQGATVDVTDAAGFHFQLHSNQAGNFYTAEKVAFPARVCVTRSGRQQCMEGPAEHGACNGCHTVPPREEAPGRISAP